MKTMIFKKGMNWTMICIVSMMTMVLASCAEAIVPMAMVLATGMEAIGSISPVSPVNKDGKFKANLFYNSKKIPIYGGDSVAKNEINEGRAWFFLHYRKTGGRYRKACIQTAGKFMDWYIGEEGIKKLAERVVENYKHSQKHGYHYYPFTLDGRKKMKFDNCAEAEKWIRREFRIDKYNKGSFVSGDVNYQKFIAIEDNPVIKGEIAARVVRELTNHIPFKSEIQKIDNIRGYHSTHWIQEGWFIYPRLNELRFMAGMQPGDKVTVEDIENFRKYAADYNKKIMALAENETVTITPTCFPDPGILNLDAELLCRYINETD